MGEMNEFYDALLKTSDSREAEKLWVGEDTRPLALDTFEIRTVPASSMLKRGDKIMLSGGLFDTRLSG